VDPEQMLQEGVRILESVLVPAGFRFSAGPSGVGSGGRFASGVFVKGSRQLEVHFRHTLGLVTYQLGSASISHEDFMRAAQAGRSRRYPGFSDDPLQGFRDLQYDLQQYGQVFLVGSDAELQGYFTWVMANPRPHGLSGLLRGGAA
jgi:hypothetical protein